MKQENIPILTHFEKEKRFFESSVNWKSTFQPLHKQFHINRLEDVVEILKFPFPPHRQFVHDFIFITKGESVRSKGLDKYNFSDNTFFFLPAYQISTHDSMSHDIKGYYCHFDMEIFNRKFINQAIFSEFSFLQFTGNPLVTISDNAKVHIISLLSRLEAEITNGLTAKLDIICVNLLALLLELNQFAKPKKVTENAASRIAQQYKNMLSHYIYEKKSVTEYAGLLNVSPNHLNKCVKMATGKSAQELLSEMVLLEAKVLLRQTSLTINEIAWKIGKEDSSDFIRFFKSKTNLTPTKYRKNY